MALLHELTSSGKKRKRVGRGGDRGGTSGAGNKGQKARSGPKIGVIFEGGQMPLTRRLPKRGFNNAVFGTTYEVINIETLSKVFDSGSTVDKEQLKAKGLLKKAQTLIKILGDGALDKQLTVYADAFSKSAQNAITASGGTVHVVEREAKKKRPQAEIAAKNAEARAAGSGKASSRKQSAKASVKAGKNKKAAKK